MKHEICWSKVLKGAAIAAGALLVASYFLPTIGTWAAAHATAGVTGWMATHIGSLVSGMLSHPIWSLTAAAVAGGVIADQKDRSQERAEAAIEAQGRAANDQSFAMREDMRRMQALMVARMMAQGYGPAAAQGQGCLLI